MFKTTDTIAYFSMEIGLDTAIPTYSGGLGVLAGDTLRAAADLGLPMVAVTLLHRHGYFHQRLDAAGNQSESPVVWVPEEVLEPLLPRVTITIEGRSVQVCAWRYDNFYLRYAVKIPLADIQYAQAQAKRDLLEMVHHRTDVRLDEGVFTIGFARRATAYKRADLLFSDLDRLRSMTRHVGPLQVIYSGKAHPQDIAGKALIRRIFAAAAAADVGHTRCQ
jgi:glucan phosphorylase